MLDQLNFLLKSHSSYLPPVSHLLSLLFLALKCAEVQIYGAAQSPVATIQPEQVICSEITDTGDRERSINDVMDKSLGVCERERETKRGCGCLEKVSTLLDKGPFVLL